MQKDGFIKDFVVERKEEIKQYIHFITDKENSLKIFHIYGPGGVGKSYFLSELERISALQNALFLKVDSQDYYHSPNDFVQHLIEIMERNYTLSPKSRTLKGCLELLADLASKQRVIITIDTFEEMGELERWFRQVFLRHISSNILIVLAGRKALKGEWIASPAWRKITTQLEISHFNLKETRDFLKHYGIHQEDAIRTIWLATDGHPLTLSIATLTEGNKKTNSTPITITENIPEILSVLTNRWLHEVKNKDMQEIIEAAAILKNFDQNSLSTILGHEMTYGEFKSLSDLSFVKKSNSGWMMHHLISDAIKVQLKSQKPTYFQSLCDRCATYYYERTIQTRSPHDIAQFFYHLGDEFIQSAFFQDSIDSSLYLEPVTPYNFHEVTEFFTYKKENLSTSEVEFYNRETNKSFTFKASLEHNKKEIDLINETYIKKLGYDVVKLLKDDTGETRGLTIIVPLYEHTVKQLIQEPVSRAYFSNLSNKEYQEFLVPKEKHAGWFIRMLDYKDSTDIAARSFSLYNLFPLLLSGGRIIISNPIPFLQDLMQNFGFEKVANATHYDYGVETPTYMLDVRGPRLAHYLKQFMNRTQNDNLDQLLKQYAFTDREKDIVKLILEQKSNAEIAAELYVAEVTVKKHITRIFAKVGVKKRAQLIKTLMENT